MRYIAIFFMLILIGYTLIAKRRIDYFSVMSFSALIYYYPALIGKLNDINYGNLITDIEPEVYFCIIAFTFILTLLMLVLDKYRFTLGNKPLFHRKYNRIQINNDYYSNLTIFILSIIGFVMFIYTLIKYQGLFVNFNKANLLMESNKIIAYYKFISLYLFVYSFINKGKFIKILRVISLILIGYTFLLGHRSYVVLGLIGVSIVYFSQLDKIRLTKFIHQNKLLFILLLLIGLFFLFIKGVFAALMAGNYDLVIARLKDPNFYLMTLLNSESNIITLNLNRVVESKMSYSLFNYLFEFLYIIPILGNRINKKLGIESFSYQLNYKFNTRFEDGYGIGSTFLGESYAIGGMLTLIIRLIILFIIVKWLMSKLYSTKNNFMIAYLSTVLPYFTFYVHRNSFLFLFITARSYIYILILCLLIRKIMTSLNKRHS